MEDTKIRPYTARVIEDPLTDASRNSPTSKLSSLSSISPSHFKTLQKLELKLDLEEVEFHKFGSICPAIRELKLSNSNIDSIRSLGTDWRNLEILWVVQTGLQNIDGISAFPKLKELYCAFNLISSLSGLIFNETVQILDFEGNQIEDMAEVEALSFCTSLFSLNLAGNPISRLSRYREKVLDTVKSVTFLDDIEKKEEVCSELSEEIEVVMNSVRETSRILKKKFDSRTRTEKNIFADCSSHLTEEVFTGNPIKAMRFRRKKMLEGNNIMNLVRDFKIQDVHDEKLVMKDFRVRSKKEGLYDTQQH